jgi:hypothetical protein
MIGHHRVKHDLSAIVFKYAHDDWDLLTIATTRGIICRKMMSTSRSN